MEFEKYFSKKKDESLKEFEIILKELNDNVKKYANSNKPILDGEILNYNEFILNKHLSKEGIVLSNVLQDYSKLFQRAVIWEHPGAMINITPPANIVSIATSAYASLYNPNFAQDESSGYLMTTELLVSKYLSELVGWNYKKSGGVFTFGGKGTNLYAVKIGLQKAIPDIIDYGIGNNKTVVFSSEKGHPCHKEICDWLGLGKFSCKRLKTNISGQLDILELEKELRKSIEHNEKIGCIILNGGTTNEIIIDPIKKIVDLRNRLVKEYGLNYYPHIHVDAVIGWAWLFFKEYDFLQNEFKMSKNKLKKIKSLTNKIKQIYYADSFGADFHKTGFCPYVSSIFMAKRYNDITMLGNKKSKNIDELKFGEYSPFEYTLELTRSSTGPISAYIALEIFGITGFQKLIYQIFSNSEYIRYKLKRNREFDVLNENTEGIATLFAIKNKKGQSIKNVLNLSTNEIQELREYNYQFYLYCLKKLEDNEVHFKLTFSKSYKPIYTDIVTGTLKMYPTSPIIIEEELDEIIEELFDVKKEFDKHHELITESRNTPIDFVYR